MPRLPGAAAVREKSKPMTAWKCSENRGGRRARALVPIRNSSVNLAGVGWWLAVMLAVRGAIMHSETEAETETRTHVFSSGSVYGADICWSCFDAATSDNDL